MKNLQEVVTGGFLSYTKRKSVLARFLLLSMLLWCSTLVAQNKRIVKGQVTDDKNEPLIGVSVIIKGEKGVGTITDINGKFSLSVPEQRQVLTFSYIGMRSQEVTISGKDFVKITLKEDNAKISEVVVVGFAKQKKESIVGAISQTTGEVLERTGGVSSLGQALTGNLPGVTTISGSGAPGGEDPTIFIRGMGTWNNSSPLILVDGIERSMSGLDISSVESISVLKDASATAVFGVKGANGVILITTKRGKEGKATINVRSNVTAKVPSKLPKKYDSYDALRIRNMAIENEVSTNEGAWADYTPYAILNKYRNPANQTEAEQYPNIDWIDQTIDNYAISYNENISVAGGNSFVKYYTAVDFLHEGDLLKIMDNDKGYTPGYGYKRINVRSNLDFKLTPSTTLTANLAGLYGDKQDIWSGDYEYRVWQAAYGTAPDALYPRYSDGVWGQALDGVANPNSAYMLANSGIRHVKTTQVNTDFTLNQDLGMFLKGLSAKGTLSVDNKFISTGGLKDDQATLQKYVYPDGRVVYSDLYSSTNGQYEYVPSPWYVSADAMDNGVTYRKMYYQLQLNYATKIGKHNVSTMGLFSRDETATGSMFPSFREDWVYRATYDYATKYFMELNGAYNGSEKFSPKYRFAFFPSAAVGWMLSNEAFLKDKSWIDMLKIRASYGQVGNDNVSDRWLYSDLWTVSGSGNLGTYGKTASPYTWYKQTQIANPDIHWETVTKKNIGLDFTFLKGLVSGTFDVFQDYHKDILLAGSSRSIPNYFGGTAPMANLGKVKINGYELEVKLNRQMNKNLRLWANINFTHSKDKILEADDKQLYDDYQKTKNAQIGQYRSQVLSGYANNWDEVYATSVYNSYDNEKLPGSYRIIDFNGDGVVNDKDIVPYGYPERPQNTYNYTLGFDYKGFSVFVQFYGVNNVTRNMSRDALTGFNDNVPVVGTYWSKYNTNADVAMPRWITHTYSTADLWNFDASYMRLKNAEVSYTLKSIGVKKMGIQSMRIFLNGDNLILWSKMPDDREANFGQMGFRGAYPTVKRFNLGVNIEL